MLEFAKGEGDGIVAGLTAPLTMVSSQNSPSDLDRLAAMLPDARHEQMGYGHYLQLLAPAAVHAVIAETMAVAAASAK